MCNLQYYPIYLYDCMKIQIIRDMSNKYIFSEFKNLLLSFIYTRTYEEL